MARLQHTQIQTNAGKLKSNESIQRSSRASDRHAFENALKIANAEKLDKVDSSTSSLHTSALFMRIDEQDEWHRYANTGSTSDSFQSVQYIDLTTANAESLPETRTRSNRDVFEYDAPESAICAKRLDEVSDWLDEMLDREGDSAGGWTFEFETDTAQLVELQLVCQQDGQWSACINLDVALDDQQELELMLSKKGVALSWTDLS